MKWLSAATKLFFFFFLTSVRQKLQCVPAGRVQFILSILPYLSVCSWRCAGQVLASTSRLLPLLRLTCLLTPKHPSSNMHVYNLFSAQALIFSCYMTERKGSGSPPHWIGLPSRTELLKVSLQRWILPPSSVTWSNACAPLSLLVIRFQKGTSCTHFQIVLSCFFRQKAGDTHLHMSCLVWIRNFTAIMVPIKSNKSANPT